MGTKAMQMMSALSQPTRLEVFRRLVAVAPDGMASGEIAAVTGTTPTAMSPHLAILARAGLVRSERRGRSIVYRVDGAPLDELVAFLQHIGATSRR